MNLKRCDIESKILNYLNSIDKEINVTDVLHYLSMNKAYTTRPTVISILNDLVLQGKLNSGKRKIKALTYLFYRKV